MAKVKKATAGKKNPAGAKAADGYAAEMTNTLNKAAKKKVKK